MRLKKKVKILLVVIASILLLLALLCGTLFYLSSPVSSKNKTKEITIPINSTHYDIASILKEENLIKNKKMFILYTKIYKLDNIYAAQYTFNTNMNLKEIIEVLSEGGKNSDEISITFNEGLTIKNISELIEKYTNNKIEDVYSLLEDETYLNELINKYWFLTEKILNDEIYYSLEGYLYPETYSFSNKDVSVKTIIEKMLDQEEKILNEYKDEITNSKYTIHEIITLASITEKEGINASDRSMIAGVFINRLNNGMSLGSDVTTYYGAKVELNERDLYQSELNEKNAYNTRAQGMEGKLPVGPICNPSKSSLEAAINPSLNDYFYFVADKDGKTHFAKTYSEHESIIANLKQEGMWYEW